MCLLEVMASSGFHDQVNALLCANDVSDDSFAAAGVLPHTWAGVHYRWHWQTEAGAQDHT